MFTFYNPHPQQKLVGDCVKRALTCATGKSYHDVSLELNRFKKKYHADSFNDWRRNVVPYMVEVLGAIKTSFPAEAGKPRMNGNNFALTHRTGTYVLQMANHVVCCKNGRLYDTWDCGEKCVYTAYRLRQKG